MYFPFVWYSTQGLCEARAQSVLHDGRSDGNAPNGSERADEIDGRGGHCMVCALAKDIVSSGSLEEQEAMATGMIERCEEREQNTRVDDPLPEVCRDHVGKVLPLGIVELQEHNQKIPDTHQGSTRPHKIGELAPTRHDDAGDEATQGSGQAWDCQTSSRFARRVEQNDLKQKRKSKEVLWQLNQPRRQPTREYRLTAYAVIPTQTLAICVDTGRTPRSIFRGIKGAAEVFASTVMKAARKTTLAIKGEITQGLDQGSSFPPRLKPTSWLDSARIRRQAPKRSMRCQMP